MQSIKVSVGDMIRINNFVPPSTNFGIVLLTGEIRLVSATKARSGNTMELNALDLSGHLQSRYVEQVGGPPLEAEGGPPAFGF